VDQDLELTPQLEQTKTVPLSSDEIFNKLFEEKQMTWIQVMEEVVEWIDLKYPAESDDLNLLEKFQTFNSFISSYYKDKK